jgi:hypothetical protein
VAYAPCCGKSAIFSCADRVNPFGAGKNVFFGGEDPKKIVFFMRTKSIPNVHVPISMVD